MQEAIDKILLLLLGIALCVESDSFLTPVIVFLIVMIYLGFSLYFKRPWIKTGFMTVLCLLVLKLPLVFFFLPMVFYDIVLDRLWLGAPGVLLSLVFFYSQRQMELWQSVVFIVGILVAVLLASRTNAQERLYRRMIILRDSGTELRNRLISRQHELVDKQDQEIRLATLQERNRIAREIHDHVGHMLSRSILQIAALMAVYKEDPLHTQLSEVNDTLNEAMNNIRDSVHDLHNESLDLKQAILEALNELRMIYQVQFEYDMSDEIPRDIKYCLISIVKEAASNVIRHSRGDKVNVLLREHPAFYQMVIEDNGTPGTRCQKPGIGLTNMEQRVAALQGQIHFSTESGFRILVSLPKKTAEIKKENLE